MNIITVNTAGGLGNLLFQIANGYFLAEKYNYNLIIYLNNRYKNNNDTQRKLANEYNIFKNFKLIDETDNSFLEYNKIHENGFRYNEIRLELDKNYNLFGYYQSYKYFNDKLNDFKNLLYNPYKLDIQNYLNNLKTNYSDNLQIVSIHFRRTDYLKHPDFHLNINLEYYIKAIEHFDINNTLFIFFSDDIEWVKEQEIFNYLPNKIYCEDINEEYNFWLMSDCNHNIIANSSFSLWASYLNSNPDKKVISPNRWFGNKGPGYDIYDIIPNNSNYIIIELN